MTSRKACWPGVDRGIRRKAQLRMLILLPSLFLSACLSLVVPPLDPTDPVDVYIVEEGMHTSLVLPRPEGGFVEYGFGEWGWYALKNTAWYNALDAVLYPSQGALGQKNLAHVPDDAQKVRVAQADAAALLKELDAKYDLHKDTEIYNEKLDMRFVVAEKDFWLLFTCSDAAAGWLRRLGCSVSWVPVRCGLKTRAREESPEPVLVLRDPSMRSAPHRSRWGYTP